MIDDLQVSKFKNDGYLLVPQVLKPDEVKQLRSFLAQQFEERQKNIQDGSANIIGDIFSAHEQLRWLLWHKPTTEILKKLLGEDFVVLRECAAHFQQFGGWHKDTTSQELAGHLFQWSENYLMVEVAYYLQDNDEEYGGGLDVQPGSHQKQDDHVVARPSNPWMLRFHRITEKVFRLLGKGGKNLSTISVESKAGDLVIFDFRINHRATPTKHSIAPLDKQKYAIFIPCSRNNEHIRNYHEYLESRPESVYSYLTNFSYPVDLITECDKNGIHLA